MGMATEEAEDDDSIQLRSIVIKYTMMMKSGATMAAAEMVGGK